MGTFHWQLKCQQKHGSGNANGEAADGEKLIRLIHQDIISYDVAISSTDQWPHATELLQHLEMSQLEAMIVSSWDCTQSWRTS